MTFLVLVAAVACASPSSPRIELDAAVIQVVQECGAPPIRPGWGASFDPTTQAATLTASDYAGLHAWADAADTWISCAAYR